MRLHSCLLAIAVLAALFPKNVQAETIIFTDRAAFNTVVQPNVFVGFDTFTGDFGEGGDFCPVESIPVCGGIADGKLFVASSEAISFPNPFGGNLTLYGNGFSYGDLNLVGPDPSTGIPFTAMGFDVIESSVTRDFFAGGQFFIRPTGFLGFLFPTPIDVARVASTPLMPGADDTRVILDNFVFKTVPVPEPSTLLLFGSALALLSVRYRRKSAQTPSRSSCLP